ncbi:hypothetical protein [Amycolatopsis sp. lyj-108]|uniref:hypothetical protein n=1 Tax=Amycolatopsis sp. lyj-108 TaxID=2789286 RepID=UPI00397B0D25
MTEPPGEGIGDKLGDAWRQVGANMTSMADDIGASFAASSITPGENIRLEPEMANAVLGRAQDLMTKLLRVQSTAQTLQQVTPAAEDLVSTAYNRKLTNGGYVSTYSPFGAGAAFDAGASQLNDAVEYLAAYIDKLNLALGKTKSTDAHNGEVLEKTGQPQEQKPGGMVG